MKWFVLFPILLFSTSVLADDSPTEQGTISFDYRCAEPLKYTSLIIQARQGGISEETMVDDIMQAELAHRLDHYSPKRVFDMIEIIHIVYGGEIDFDNVEDVQNIYIAINDYCSGDLPPEKLEDRRWYDEDGDGIPDYDGDGEPLEELEAESSKPIST